MFIVEGRGRIGKGEVKAMTEQEAYEILLRVGAVLRGHFRLKSGEHSDQYVNKDKAYPDEELSELCLGIAERFVDDDPEVVIGPAQGGIALSHWVAHHLRHLTGHRVLALYADKVEPDFVVMRGQESLFTGKAQPVLRWVMGHLLEVTGCEVVEKEGDLFVITRGYDELITGRRVLGVEDVLTTGGSAWAMIKKVLACGGKVIGLGAIWNRKRVQPEAIGVPRIESLVNREIASWPPAVCSQCADNVPLDEHVGHGRPK